MIVLVPAELRGLSLELTVLVLHVELVPPVQQLQVHNGGGSDQL